MNTEQAHEIIKTGYSNSDEFNEACKYIKLHYGKENLRCILDCLRDHVPAEKSPSIIQLIYDLLIVSSPLTAKDIASRLDMKRTSVSRALTANNQFIRCGKFCWRARVEGN